MPTSARVVLRVLSGAIAGREFCFDAHDTFIFGRHKDCHARLPDDRHVSRYHFILEANPPDVRLRDLGSLNSTVVNGVKSGGRPANESPEEARRRTQPNVELKNGDVIEVGNTRIEVSVSGAEKVRRQQNPLVEAVSCTNCGTEMTRDSGKRIVDQELCPSCRKQGEADFGDSVTLLKKTVTTQHYDDRRLPRIEGYQVQRKLGEGGMGVVYLASPADDPAKKLALKLLPASDTIEDRVKRRFLREIEVGMRFEHPRIVRLLDAGQTDSQFYFAMEYCRGGSLEERLREMEGRLPLRKAIPLMLHCLDGMAHAHRSRLVHRDLKPANILLHEEDGKLRPKISDFGLAKCFQLAGLSGMTATGSFGGSWHYMPREQLTNFKYVEPMSDIWSLGATFYRLLTGKHAREFAPDRDPVEVVLDETAIPIRNRNKRLPARLAAVIDKSLETEPEHRYADATEMKDALEAALREARAAK